MRDHIDIGSSPCDEDCVQVEPTGAYLEPMRAECRRYLALIRVKLGPEPEGAKLGIRTSLHDFGSYMEVVCYYDDQDEEAQKYAYRCEAEAPTTWDDDGRREQPAAQRAAALAAAMTHDGLVLFLEQEKAQQAA